MSVFTPDVIWWINMHRICIKGNVGQKMEHKLLKSPLGKHFESKFSDLVKMLLKYYLYYPFTDR